MFSSIWHKSQINALIWFFQVKVDAKTKSLLDEYKKKKKKKEREESGAGEGDKPKSKGAKEEKEEGEEDDDDEVEEGEEADDEDDLDEFTLREDRVAQAGLDAIMREYSEDLSKTPYSGREESLGVLGAVLILWRVNVRALTSLKFLGYWGLCAKFSGAQKDFRGAFLWVEALFHL